jgi:hypothetical protein
MVGRSSSIIFSEFKKRDLVSYSKEKQVFHCQLCGSDINCGGLIKRHLAMKHRAEYQNVKARLNESI